MEAATGATGAAGGETGKTSGGVGAPVEEGIMDATGEP